MSLSSTASKERRRFPSKRLKSFGCHERFVARVQKSLYYSQMPETDRFSLPVTELAAELFSKARNGRTLDRLDLSHAAEISRNACVSPCSLVLALVYLERLKCCNPDYLEKVAPSELFVVSMMVASKFLHDDGEEDEVFNDEWAKSAGLEVKEMNELEREFLKAIDWEVFVSEKAFWTRLKGVENELAMREGNRRGWFSYTEMDKLLDGMDVTKVAQTVLTVSAVCLTSYTASVLTLIGSALIVGQFHGLGQRTSVSVPQGNDFETPSTFVDMNEPSRYIPTSIDPSHEDFIPESLDNIDSLNTGCCFTYLDNSSLEDWQERYRENWHHPGWIHKENVHGWASFLSSGNQAENDTSQEGILHLQHRNSNKQDIVSAIGSLEKSKADGQVESSGHLSSENDRVEEWADVAKCCVQEALKEKYHQPIFSVQVAVSH